MANPWSPVEEDIWPELRKVKTVVAAVGVGIDRATGRPLIGWPHVVQSIHTLFATRYHERVLRRWVGSFVPHLLGELGTQKVIARFFWAVTVSIDLWEPRYTVTRVRMLRRASASEVGGEILIDVDPGELTSVEEIRRGEVTFALEGIYRPRGHLGDLTPETRRGMSLIGKGAGKWEVRL